jgi:glutaredoxin-like YruB-family protein
MENRVSKNIIIYSTPLCPFCIMVKRYLAQKGFEYEEVDVSKNPDLIEVIYRKSGQTGVPVVDIDGKVIVGFDKRSLNEELDL